MPFVVCLSAAAQGSGGISKAKAQKCASGSQLVWATLDTCWTGAEGKALDIAAAAKTAALNPPHQYVPWVTLDAPGTFCTENGCDNFIAEASAARARAGGRAHRRVSTLAHEPFSRPPPPFRILPPQVCKAYTGTKPPACSA